MLHFPLSSPTDCSMNVKVRDGNRQFSPEMKVECLRRKTGSEETCPETLVLLSQLGQVMVKQHHKRETPASIEPQLL